MIKFREKRKITRKPTKDIVVIYHGDCSDGFGGAWVAWKKFQKRADYIGAFHGDEPSAGLIGKEVYFIDFVYPKPIMEQLKKTVKKMVIIDHHKTAMDVLDLADEKLFNIKHSGAVLSWNYFYPDKSIPSLLKYIEDRDLWFWKLDKSREVLAYFDLFIFDFKIWDDIISKLDSNKVKKKEFVANGTLLMRQWNNLCGNMLNDAAKVEFEGYRIYCINTTHIFSSDLGNLLSEKLPPMAIAWHQGSDGNFGVSLRSDGTLDVSEIAKKYGGGGHKAAAGFRIMAGKPFPWKIIKKDEK